ncbi:MAG: LytTR family transcriptional regulator DNA-binding domain-containing protein [Bacteroidia bacterium]
MGLVVHLLKLVLIIPQAPFETSNRFVALNIRSRPHKLYANMTLGTITRRSFKAPLAPLAPLAPNLVFIKTRKGFFSRVEMRSISHVYLESNQVFIKTQKQCFSVDITLLAVLDVLPSRIFFRCHRNHIINLEMVDVFYIDTQEVLLEGNYISVGKTYRKELVKSLNVLHT